MNNNKPIIGIVGSIDEKEENKVYITLDEHVRKSIILSGGVPILILPTQHIHYSESKRPSEIARLTKEEKLDLERQVDLCDGILFQGGKRWYEHHEYVLNLALNKNKSILGICLGMQMMVGAITRKYGDGTYKNIENNTYIDHKNTPGNEYSHSISILDNTILKGILNTDTCKVNSRHNYHIGEVHEYIISSYSEDGIPEAIEMPNKKFVIGVQWHPELLIENDDNSKKLLNAFIESCKKNHIM